MKLPTPTVVAPCGRKICSNAENPSPGRCVRRRKIRWNRRSFLSHGAASLSSLLLVVRAWAQSAGEVVCQAGHQGPSGSPGTSCSSKASQRDQELSDKVKLPHLSRRAPWAMKATWLGRCASASSRPLASAPSGSDVTPEPQASTSPPRQERRGTRQAPREVTPPTLDQLPGQEGLCRPFVGATSASPISSRRSPVQHHRGPAGQKLFCWDGDLASKDAWLASGFKNIVVLSSNDICRRSPPA